MACGLLTAPQAHILCAYRPAPSMMISQANTSLAVGEIDKLLTKPAIEYSGPC